jgi:hypothetical protein
MFSLYSMPDIETGTSRRGACGQARDDGHPLSCARDTRDIGVGIRLLSTLSEISRMWNIDECRYTMVLSSMRITVKGIAIYQAAMDPS